MSDIMNQSVTSSRPQGIARRLILAMVVFSSLITLIVTAIQLYRDYNRDLLLIDAQLNQIEDVHLPSIAGSLWLLDESGVQTLVDGILQLPDMLYLEVSDGERVWAADGVNQSENVIVRRYSLTHQHLGSEQTIGVMTAVATLDRVYQRLIDKTVDILVSNAIKTFLVAGFILLLFHYLVTRHLIEIASFVRDQNLNQPGPPLLLDRNPKPQSKPDELDLLVDELNQMRSSLQESFSNLKESEIKYRELYDTMAQGVIYRNENGDIVSVNNAAKEILGLSLEQIQGKADVNETWKAINEDGTQLARNEFPSVKSLRTGKGVDNSVMGIFHPVEKKYRWILVNSKPWIKAGSNRAIQAFSTFTDITDRKRADEEREKLIKQLEIKNTELERFVYTISHELKSPLVTIAGFSGILMDDVESKDIIKLASHVKHITKAVDNMSILLDELLELSRIGRVNYRLEKIELSSLAAEVVESIKSRPGFNEFTIEIADDLPVLHGDRLRLQEVLQNLIGNAAKFHNDRKIPHIEVGSRKDGSEEVIFVRDNGQGIDPAYHERIFSLFERLDTRIEGTGVGLALVHRILEEHGGRVWVESEGVGMGSTFCFVIPQQEVKDKNPGVYN